jgi:hypothetical protein
LLQDNVAMVVEVALDVFGIELGGGSGGVGGGVKFAEFARALPCFERIAEMTR